MSRAVVEAEHKVHDTRNHACTSRNGASCTRGGCGTALLLLEGGCVGRYRKAFVWALDALRRSLSANVPQQRRLDGREGVVTLEVRAKVQGQGARRGPGERARAGNGAEQENKEPEEGHASHPVV